MQDLFCLRWSGADPASFGNQPAQTAKGRQQLCCPAHPGPVRRNHLGPGQGAQPSPVAGWAASLGAPLGGGTMLQGWQGAACPSPAFTPCRLPHRPSRRLSRLSMRPAMPNSSAWSWLLASATGSLWRSRAEHPASSRSCSVAFPSPRLSEAAPRPRASLRGQGWGQRGPGWRDQAPAAAAPT